MTNPLYPYATSDTAKRSLPCACENSVELAIANAFPVDTLGRKEEKEGKKKRKERRKGRWMKHQNAFINAYSLRWGGAVVRLINPFNIICTRTL